MTPITALEIVLIAPIQYVLSKEMGDLLSPVFPMIILRNTVCWLCSALLAVCLFSGYYASPRNTASIAFVFRTALLFAFPVACVYLPFVLRLSRTGQLFLLAMGAALIGPASIGLLGVVLGVADTPYAADNGVGPGFGAVLVFALLIGSLAGMAYVIAFKMLGRLTHVKSACADERQLRENWFPMQ